MTRIGAFLLLFDPLQTNISFGHFPESCFPFLGAIISNISNLATLNLRCVWLHGKALQNLVNSIPSLSQLRHLIVPYIGDDALVSAVGRHCPCLELLDLSGVSAVTDQGVRALYRKNVGGELWPTELTGTMRYLLVGGPGGNRLQPLTVGTLLIKIPLLVSLGSYPYTGQALTKVGTITE